MTRLLIPAVLMLSVAACDPGEVQGAGSLELLSGERTPYG